MEKKNYSFSIILPFFILKRMGGFMPKILIVEDVQETRELLKLILSKLDNLFFLEASSLEEATSITNKEEVDIILLDFNLPDGNGSQLIKTLKKNPKTNLPFIVAITAETSQESVNKSLESGCEYYVKKPFDSEEIQIRIKKLIARLPEDKNILKYKNICIYKDENIVTYLNEKLILSKHEFELLLMFMLNKGLLLTREKILDEVWYDNFDVSDKAVDQCIKRLRKKIPILNEILISKRGFGYIFE